jgi:rhodanese-related sulfurtransferase
MTTVTLSPSQAAARIKSGALLVDVREDSERRRLHIPGSLHKPMSKGMALPDTASEIIFHCASGVRTRTSINTLKSACSGQIFLMDGGIDAWKKAGFPVVEDHSQPIDIMRQVMIAAGSLVLIGVLLGSIVNPLFYALSGFVGAGLLFAGATGICAMARMLALAPWNRPRQA